MPNSTVVLGSGSGKRVVFVISSLAPGGAERVMTTMANYWANQGRQVTILSLDNGALPPFFELNPLVRHVPLGVAGESSHLLEALWNNVRRICVLRRAIAQANPEAIISFMDKTNVVTLLAAWGLNFKIIVAERTDPNHYPIGRIWSALRRWTYARASRIVVQTESVRAYFSPRFQDKVMVIPNPVLPPLEDSAAIAGGATDRLILAVGRLVEEKGFSDLIRAFGEIKDRHPDWTVVIAGDGPQRQTLERLCEKLGIAGRVRLPGFIKNPLEMFRRTAMFVLSSRFEGFPNALCEAMARGLPVIATDCPSGPREIIRNEQDGLLVPLNDISALSAAMERLMVDEEERRRLGSRAKEIVERFSLQRVMAQWEQELKSPE